MLRARSFLIGLLVVASVSFNVFASEDTSSPSFAPVVPGYVMTFPRDHGAHPDFRTEWWYVTGQVSASNGRRFGFQVTFFRSRTSADPKNPSRFNPTQIIFANAALSEPAAHHFDRDERIARRGFGLASFDENDAAVTVKDWNFRRDPGDGTFHTGIVAREFKLALQFRPTEAILPEGEGGFSKKGALAADASEYYSIPQLAVTGSIATGTATLAVTGRAWLDHEWSSHYMDADAVGWDWAGINLDDGGAMMAFQMRARDGKALWSAATLREADGKLRTFESGDVAFTTVRTWRSPTSGTTYPVEQELRIGSSRWHLTPTMAEQEIDTRSTTGVLYWEGAIEVRPASTGATVLPRLGEGFLEMTGYGSDVRF